MTAIDAYQEFRSRLERLDLGDFAREHAVDVETYRHLFAAFGLPLPDDFARFLAEIGRIETAVSDVDVAQFPFPQGTALSLVSPFDLVDWWEHQHAATYSGVERVGDMIVFATTPAEHDGLWVFDYVDGFEPTVGWYHQDRVSYWYRTPEPEEGIDRRLPEPFPSFDAFFAAFFERFAASLEEAAVESRAEQIGEARVFHRRPTNTDAVERFVSAHPSAIPWGASPERRARLEKLCNDALLSEPRSLTGRVDTELQAWRELSRGRKLAADRGAQMWWEIEAADGLPTPGGVHSVAAWCRLFSNTEWLRRDPGDDERTFLVSRSPTKSGGHPVYEFDPRKMEFGRSWRSIAAYLESMDARESADVVMDRSVEPRRLARRSAWLAGAIEGVGFRTIEEDLQHADGLAQFDVELPHLGDHPHLTAYWLWTHAIFGNREALERTREAVSDDVDANVQRILDVLGDLDGEGHFTLGALGPSTIDEYREAAPERMRAGQTSSPSENVVDALMLFADEFDGSQRELLATLREEWADRLSGHEPVLLEEVGKAIRKVIKSPKLRDDRDAFVASLDGSS